MAKEVQTTTESNKIAGRPVITVYNRKSGFSPAPRFGMFSAGVGRIAEKAEERLARVHVLPVGDFEHPHWGKFSLTPADMAQAQANFDRYNEKGGIVNLYFDHYSLPRDAAGRFISLDVQPSGLWATVKLTEEGYDALVSGRLPRFSAEWHDNGWKDETGEEYEGVFISGGALTPEPFFGTTLEGVYLVEDGGLLQVATRPVEFQEKQQTEKKDMEIDLKEITGVEEPEAQEAKILEWKAKAEKHEEVTAENEELKERTASLEAAKKEPEKKAATLEKHLADVQDSNNELKRKVAAMERKETLTAALQEGKIDPHQMKLYLDPEDEDNPFPDIDNLKKHLASLKAGSQVNLEAKGSEEEPETVLDEDDKKIASQLDMSEEDYARYQKGEVKRKEA